MRSLAEKSNSSVFYVTDAAAAAIRATDIESVRAAIGGGTEFASGPRSRT